MSKPSEHPAPDHTGHRDRVRNRFLREGLDGFAEVHCLEFLLFFVIPRHDTNLIAHDLLKRFGSFAGVLEAPLSELEKVPGMGKKSALLLHLMPSLCRYYRTKQAELNTVLSDLDKCADYLTPRFFGLRDECVFALCLDAKCKVLGCQLIGHGSVNSANVPIRRIVEYALSLNASSLVLAHNHPSGIAIPSQEDLDATVRLSAALDAVGIILADHIVVADDDYVSMAQSGQYQAPLPDSP